GPALKASLPPDTRIATTLAGTIPYFSGLHTVDQWGINDHYVAHLPEVPINFRGHVKPAPREYIIEQRVNLYIEHPVICPCDGTCFENLPNVFVRLPSGRCMRSWYLTQTPELTRHLCSHPEAFLLHNIDCPPAEPGTVGAQQPLPPG